MPLKRGYNIKATMLWASSREKDSTKLKKGCNTLMNSTVIIHAKSQSLDQIHHIEVEEQQ
jgi:hypothetical protein